MNKTGFDAMGLPVPSNRLDNGYKCVKEMIPVITNGLAYSIVAKCANIIKRDEPLNLILMKPK